MSLDQNLDKILIIDFGSQFTQLIARRIRELGVFSEIVCLEQMVQNSIDETFWGQSFEKWSYFSSMASWSLVLGSWILVFGDRRLASACEAQQNVSVFAEDLMPRDIMPSDPGTG